MSMSAATMRFATTLSAVGGGATGSGAGVGSFTPQS